MFNETLVILQRELWKAFAQTFVMMGISFVLSLILGLALGFVLYLTETPAFYPKKSLNAVAAAIVNFIRSIPFIILVVFTLPFTFWLVGTKIGPIAASVPLTISATVFLARLVESSLKETDPGVIEAALASGARPWLIIRKVLLVEAAPSIARAVTVVFINLIGASAMAGMVGGGGIGNLAVQYGYYRYETGVMLFTIVVLVIVVQLSQYLGDKVAKHLSH